MRSRYPFGIRAAFPIAALLGAISLGGLLAPAVYARETPAWVDQAVGQDAFDLLVVVPWLVICGIASRSGSYRWGVLLAGAYAYTIYEALIYAFAVHFNALFLVYCATLGLASFGLIAQLRDLGRHRITIARRPARIAAGFLFALGVVFTMLWLAEDLPAALRGESSPALVETGLFTNPVHVIDLSFLLPAFVVVAVQLWRRRSDGFLYMPVLLAFGAVMAASIAGMLTVIWLSGGEAPTGVIAVMSAVTLVAAIVWCWMVRNLRESPALRHT